MTTGWTAKIPQLPSHRHSFISHAVAIISLKDPLGFCRNVHLLGADAHCTASKKQIDGLMDGYKFVTCWNLGWVNKLDFLARKVCCDWLCHQCRVLLPWIVTWRVSVNSKIKGTTYHPSKIPWKTRFVSQIFSSYSPKRFKKKNLDFRVVSRILRKTTSCPDLEE